MWAWLACNFLWLYMVGICSAGRQLEQSLQSLEAKEVHYHLYTCRIIFTCAHCNTAFTSNTCTSVHTIIHIQTQKSRMKMLQLKHITASPKPNEAGTRDGTQRDNEAQGSTDGSLGSETSGGTSSEAHVDTETQLEEKPRRSMVSICMCVHVCGCDDVCFVVIPFYMCSLCWCNTVIVTKLHYTV